MSNQTEFLPLDEAAALLKVSVNSLLNQAMEGLLQIYWLLNKTLYSDTLELQSVGVFPAYYGQDIEEWSTNLSVVPSSKHFTFIPLYREKAGDLLTNDSTECWVSEISTPEETFSLAEPEAFAITRQHLALMRKDLEDWDERFGGPESEVPDFDNIQQSQTPPATSGTTTIADIRALPNLRWDEVSIALVGNKTQGLAGNNMLEIRARGLNHRVALAEFDLVDRRTGALNKQAAMLIGLANGHKLLRSKEVMSAIMKRLRAAMKNQLGLANDPFDRYQKESGWRPLFQLSDQRGLADKRAQTAAERRTVSYDQLQDMGLQFEAEEDETTKWLQEHDPQSRG